MKPTFELISIQSNKGTPLSAMHQLYENANFSVNYPWLQFDSAAPFPSFSAVQSNKVQENEESMADGTHNYSPPSPPAHT